MKLREWPLVLFTVLGQAAAGLAVVLILPLYVFPSLSFLRALDRLRLSAGAAVVVLLGTAALLSLFHLGKPQRAYRALFRTGSSWLSREVLAEMIFLAAAAMLAVLAWTMPRSAAGTALAVLVIAEAGAFVYSMARIYTISAVPVWFSPATLISFLSTSLVLGSLAAAVLAGADFLGANPDLVRLREDLGTAALVILGAAFLLVILYAPRFGTFARKDRLSPAAPRRGLAFAQSVRIVLLAGALGALGFGGSPVIALSSAFASEVLGRFIFYSLPAGF